MKWGKYESENPVNIVRYGLCGFYPDFYRCFCMVIPVLSHWKQNHNAVILGEK